MPSRGYKQSAEHVESRVAKIRKRVQSAEEKALRVRNRLLNNDGIWSSGLKPNKISDVWKYIDKRGPDECWPWKAATTRGGYGVFRVAGKYYKAHRLAYIDALGGIDLAAPKSNYDVGFVLHRCDNAACCNPAHLYVGDINDNMRDKVVRGRQSRKGGRPRLSASDAKMVWQQLLRGAKPKELAKRLGIGIHVIYNIKEGRTYRAAACP